MVGGGWPALRGSLKHLGIRVKRWEDAVSSGVICGVWCPADMDEAQEPQDWEVGQERQV